MNPRFSLTALGLPGRFIISELPRMAATPLESMALGVISKDFARIYSSIPGTCLSDTFKVASGALSRGESPVPPVVNIRFSFDSSQRRMSSASRPALSSEISSCSFTSKRPSFSRISLMAGPLRSYLCPAAPLSLKVIIPTVYFILILSDKMPAFAAVLLQQTYFTYLHSFIYGFAHIIHREKSD